MHVLVWGAPDHNPDFIENETDPAKLEKFMLEYIEKTMKRYGDFPVIYDVVNESIHNRPQYTIKDSPWSKVDDYICKAFKAARAANPKAQLYYNDYKHASQEGEYASKHDRVFDLVKELKERGCGIDGVGFQSHVDINYADHHIESIHKSMQRYAELGLDV